MHRSGSRRPLGRPARRAAHSGDGFSAAGSAGHHPVAASHGAGREEQEEEGQEGGGRGVLQRDTLHSIPDEALLCLKSQHQVLK